MLGAGYQTLHLQATD